MFLITGGLGYIGSHTCVSLMSHGNDVLVVDSLVNSKKSNLKKIKKAVEFSKKGRAGKLFFYEGDLRDQVLLDLIFEKQIVLNQPIEAVIHFAGLKSVEESVSEPLKYWEVNINSTLNLLSTMKKFNCSTLVFSSSATIYRPLKDQKLFEDSFKYPINPYGNTKLTIERILEDVFASNKDFWKIINLRYFNPVGAHSSGILGEDQKGRAINLFPVLEDVVNGKLDKVLIFGNDWPTEDGTCIRDFIHIMDLSEAHFAALKFLKKNDPQFNSINIGTGKGCSVLEIIKIYSKINKIPIPYEFAKRRKGDAPYLVADNRLAIKLLEWKPLNNIEDICIDSFRFLRSKFK